MIQVPIKVEVLEERVNGIREELHEFKDNVDESFKRLEKRLDDHIIDSHHSLTKKQVGALITLVTVVAQIILTLAIK